MGATAEQGDSSEMVVESITKSVECPVCRDVYSSGGGDSGCAAASSAKTPKILPCFHTVCLECVKQLDKCPSCSKPISAGECSALPTNFIALEVAEALSLKSGTPKGCVLCGEGEATHFCSKCSAYMCLSCQASHSRQHLTRDHAVLTMEQARAQVSRVVSVRTKMCDVHPTEERDIFCTTCQEIGCMKCMLLSHSQAQGHDYRSLDVAFGKAEEEVRALMEQGKAAEELLEESLRAVASVKDELEANADAAEEQLAEGLEQLLAKVRGIKAAKITALNTFKDKLEANADAVEEELSQTLKQLGEQLRDAKAAKMKALTTDEDELRLAVAKSRTVREFAEEAMGQDSKVHLLSLKCGIVEGLKEVVGAQGQHQGPAATGSLSVDSKPSIQEELTTLGSLIEASSADQVCLGEPGFSTLRAAEAELRKREAAEAEAEKRKREAAEAEAERRKREAAEADAERRKREAAEAAAEKRKREAAKREAELCNTQGNLAYNNGDYHGAIRHYSAAIDLVDDEPAYYTNLACAHWILEDHDNTLLMAEKALQLGAGNALRHRLKVRALEALGRPGEAEAALAAGLALAPEDELMRFGALEGVLKRLRAKERA